MRTKGFTLVEILIVVVILGILAAIVIPQFTDASTQARESSLASDLQTLRSQIELYKVQHKDKLPGTVSGVTFVQAITGLTDIDGNVAASGAKPGDVGVYGPYMKSIPYNPFNNKNTVEVVNDASAGVGDGGTKDGWWFNSKTGEIRANDAGSSPDGTKHTAL